MNKRRELGEQSREKILDAAERLLSQRGFTGMSTNQLSKDSGLPVASIYWHFGSKVGVLAAVLERRADAVFDDILNFDAGTLDPFDALSLLVEQALSGAAKYPDFFRIIALVSMESIEGADQILATIQGIHDRVVTVWHETLVRVFQPKAAAERAATWDLAELARAMYLGGIVLFPTQGQAPSTRAIRAYMGLLQMRADTTVNTSRDGRPLHRVD